MTKEELEKIVEEVSIGPISIEDKVKHRPKKTMHVKKMAGYIPKLKVRPDLPAMTTQPPSTLTHLYAWAEPLRASPAKKT